MRALVRDVALATGVFVLVTLAWRLAGGDTGILGSLTSAIVFALAYGAVRVALVMAGDSEVRK